MVRWISLFALIVGLVGCADAENGATDSAATPGAGPDAPADGAEEPRRVLEAELVAADRAFADAVVEHGLSGWVQGFAPAGRMVLGGESHIGREGIRRTMLPLFADSTLSLTWDPTYAEVAASGNLGYTVGRYEVSAEGDAAPVAGTGTYLRIWERQDDGGWRVKADIGSPDAEGPGTP